MFGYHGRCNRHTKSLLLAVKYGSWEGDAVGDTSFPNVGKKTGTGCRLTVYLGYRTSHCKGVASRTGFKDIQLLLEDNRNEVPNCFLCL